MTELNNYLDEYVGECQEVLDRVSLNLARIEKNDGDPEIITSVYRDIHTIKGTSQLFGFQQMGQVAHAIESSLDPVRKGDRELLSAHTDVIFSAVDIMLRILNGIRSSKAEPDLKNGLAQLLDAILSISNVAQKSAKETPSTETGISQAGQGTTPQKDSPSLNAKLEDQQSDTIRIHVGLLDSLMNLTGELVLIRNQVAQLTRTIENNELHTISQRLNALTGELQNDVMKTRMQPIGAILNRFNRMVRDSAKDLGKSINLAIEGAETELDKTLIDAVKDPLTHIVRNSVDHGIESPETRRLNKKAPQGNILIRSYHESGQFIIEVKDDGKGLDPATIGSKAIEKGILTAEQLAKMPDQAILQLIFTAGFSTASNVSSLSGRGVGMDVVKTNTERIGGVVGLSSTPGNGTTVKLCIPLTLAIVPALLVRTRGHCYAIPQAKLLELIAVDADSKLGQIEELQGQRIYRLRGKIIPVISLAEILGYTALESPPSVTQGREPLDSNFKKSFESSTSLNLVILKFDQQVFALAVEEIEDSTDIVVKPLSSFLKELAMFSGATILGNGAVALTIDVNGLARAAMIKPLTAGEESATGLSAASSLSEALQNAAEYLLVDVGRTGLYAIPLNGVDRLEEFRMDAVTFCGEIPVVQYRDQLLKIVSAESILNGSSQPSFKVGANLEPEGLAIVVLRTAGAHAGIQVRQILDIVTIQGSVRTLIRKQPGILGTLIHEGKVITILDVASVSILKACANLDRANYQGSSITSFPSMSAS